MPKKREITVYEFDELSDKAKKRAIQWYREASAGDTWQSEEITDLFKQDLETMGLPNKDIGWSLNYSQGDGVAFYGNIDLEEYLKSPMDPSGRKGGGKGAKQWSPRGGAAEKRKFAPLVNKIGIEIRKDNSHYDHWNSMGVYEEAYEDLTPEENRLLDEFLKFIGQHIKDVSKGLEKMGYDEIEYQNSDETISENIRANEYEFDEHGDRI